MKLSKKLGVLVVDDSILFRQVIVNGISKDPGIEVVGTAGDAATACRKCDELHPDVVSLDMEMPGMSGTEFLKRMMPRRPTPVIMVSGATESVFDALQAGAVDFVEKPSDTNKKSTATFINELIIKIKIASTVKVGALKHPIPGLKLRGKDSFVVAIGASTGGTEAILEVVKNLPAEIPGMVIVQHMPPVFTKMYADRLNNLCNITVKEAESGDVIVPGLALVAPGGKQMKIMRQENRLYVKCYDGGKINGVAPSVDVTFDSLADCAGKNSLGVILTGMGRDGASGLLKMRNAGAHTIGQDEKTCVVYGMPMVAYNIGAVEKQCPLELISAEILAMLGKVGAY